MLPSIMDEFISLLIIGLSPNMTSLVALKNTLPSPGKKRESLFTQICTTHVFHPERQCFGVIKEPSERYFLTKLLCLIRNILYV